MHQVAREYQRRTEDTRMALAAAKYPITTQPAMNTGMSMSAKI